MTIERHEVGPRMSQCVVHNGVVYTAGQVDPDMSPTAGAQTHKILARIDELLEMAGTNKSKLLTATIWLSDMRYFAEMNEVWDAWVSVGNTPARACIEAKLATPDFLVEVRVTAAQ